MDIDYQSKSHNRNASAKYQTQGQPEQSSDLMNKLQQTPANEAYVALEQSTQRSEIVGDHIVEEDLGAVTIEATELPPGARVISAKPKPAADATADRIVEVQLE